MEHKVLCSEYITNIQYLPIGRVSSTSSSSSPTQPENFTGSFTVMSELFKLTVILIRGGYIFLSCLRLMSSKLFFQNSISEAFICKIKKPNHLLNF